MPACLTADTSPSSKPTRADRGGAPTPSRALDRRVAQRLRDEAAAYLKLRDESNALPEDQWIGRIVRFVVGDGMAVYRLASLEPLALEHQASCGAYQLPADVLRRLSVADVVSRITRDRQRHQLYTVCATH